MNTQKNIKELRTKAQELEPIVRIGKSGLTATVIKEIKKLLRKKKLIKIKILPSALDSADKVELINKLISESGGDLVHKIGFSVVLAYKKKRIVKNSQLSTH